MKTVLRIMAAGIGSRFGTGIKQLEPVDASEHIIMGYSMMVLQRLIPVTVMDSSRWLRMPLQAR